VQTALPDASGLIPAVSALAPLVLADLVRPFVEADRAFAAQAGRDGAAAAFGAFAAPEAVTFSGAGTLNRGPEAIRRALSGGPPADWVWGPVAAGASVDGTLGWTVGEATISARGASLPPYQGKYLSVWRRDADGQVRFVADLGNGRPAR
jgi:ketosteroid isomerase-like protein